MKKLINIYIILIVAGFIFGTVTAILSTKRYPWVEIDISNKTGKGIKQVELIHKVDSKSVKNIASGQTKKIRLFNRKEIIYVLVAEFEDGRKVTSAKRFARPGFVINEIISDTGIDAKYDLEGTY